MRIGLVTPEYPGCTPSGGIGSYVQAMAPALEQRGHKVCILLCTSFRQPFETENSIPVIHVASPRYISWVPFPVGRGSGIMLGRGLAARAQALRLDILEAPEFGGLSAFLPGRGSRPFRVIVRLHTCSWLVKSSNNSRTTSPKQIAGRFLVNRIEKRAIKNADAVTSISPRTTEETLRVYHLQRDDVVSIPNPVRAAFFDEPACETSANGSDPVVLYVGRLEWRKGPDLLVQAFAEVAERFPRAKLQFVGRDTPTAPGGSSMLRYIRSLVAESVFSRIEFLGEQPHRNLPRFYRNANVCVFPSRWEGFGIVCAEAMAAGKPVIVPGNSGFAEHITHYANGVLVPEKDPRSLAQALAEILSDPTFAAHIGAAARQYAVEHFQNSTVVNATLRVYEDALSRPS